VVFLGAMGCSYPPVPSVGIGHPLRTIELSGAVMVSDHPHVEQTKPERGNKDFV